MKKHILISLFILWGMGVLFSACEKGFEEINTDPNQPTSTDPDYLFNYVVQQAGGDFALYDINHRFVLKWVMQSAYSWGNSTWPPFEAITATNISSMWNYFYTTVLMNNNRLIDLTADNPDQVNQHAIARIMKAYTVHRMTDLWGDIPYFDAGRAYNENRVLKPEYDTQEAIYADLLKELSEAAAELNPDKGMYEYDLIYQGDIEKWRKFAHSLRLRLAIRSGNQTVVEELMQANNLFAANEDAAFFQYLTNDGDWSPYYEMHETSATSIGKISQYMADTMTYLDDPRLEQYANPDEVNDSIIGAPNFMKVEEMQALGVSFVGTSYHGDFIFAKPDWKKPMLSYAEVCFLKAEAAARGWGATAAQAEDFYNEGIRASMKQYEIDDTAIDEYLAGPAAFNSSADDLLEQIITQKWIALYFDGFELFAEYRRTGYPEFRKYQLTLDGSQIHSKQMVNLTDTDLQYPQRLPYPEKEADFNAVHYNAAVSRQGGEGFYTPIWWAK